MKFYLFVLIFITSFNLNAQIEAVNTDKGSSQDEVTDIIVVFKMHFDIGYTNWAEGILQEYRDQMLEETLKSIEETSLLPKSEQFKWTVPSWPLKYMLENSTVKNKLRLENAIKEDRIIPHALPVTFETEASDLENLVRGLSYASQINRKYGLPLPREAKLTDVPSHSRVLPTLLKNAGIDILHIGCNPGSTAPDIPPLFWWQGPDGSKLLTFYWAEYYGSGILPPKEWKHKTWLAMIFTHENSGAPTPEDVAEVLRSAKEKMPNARVKIGRISDFYDLLIKENPTLPIITGDMPDTWIHGYMSMPHETKLSKHLQRETYDTEILNTQMKQWLGSDNPIESYIDNAVENMILFDEHTFGVAMTHGNQHKWTYDDDFKINKSLGNYDFIESAWQEKANRIENAERIVKPIMRRQLKELAASVAVDGKRIVVYNPLPWSRSGRVNFFTGIYQKDFQIYGLKDAESGKIISVYNDYNLTSFDAENVPSMGYKTYIPILTPINVKSSIILDEENHLLENDFFRIKLNPTTGALSSVYDRQNKKELVDQKSEEGFAEYFYEQVGQDQIDEYNKAYIKPGAARWANDEMIRPSSKHKETKIFKGRVEKIVYLNMENAVRATVFGRLDDTDTQEYLVTYTLYENQPYIEIAWGVDGKKPNPSAEAGWLSFPFDLNNPEYRLFRTGGIVDPQKEIIEGSNKDFYFLNTSMAMYDKSNFGIVLNSPSSPGISIDNTGLFKFSKTKVLTSGKVFVNLFNTQWGTNFTEWIEGSFSSKLYIWSYKNYDIENNFITPTEETRVPLKGIYYDGDKGEAPVKQGGVMISRNGIIITAFGENRDGDGTILRFWEQIGENGLCIVTLPKGNDFKTAFPCNLRGEITDHDGISISNNQFQFTINANQPASFILK